MEKRRKTDDLKFQQTLISRIPRFVWGVVATLFAVMLTLNLSGLNFGTAINVIAFSYAEKYKRRAELGIESDKKMFKRIEIIQKQLSDNTILIKLMTDRVEKLEKHSHAPAKKKRIETQKG